MGFLFDITSAAAAAETLEETLEDVAQHLQRIMGALSVVMYLPQVYIDDFGNSFSTLKPAALAGADQPLSEIEEVRTNLPDHLINLVYAAREVSVVDDLTAEDSHYYLPVASEARSVVMVPLLASGEVIGIIVMEAEQPNAFDADYLQLLKTMAGALSAIVRSSQLLEQLTRTNEQLRELDRLKSDFLANMSHELRTPLNSIIGFSRVMLKGIDGPLTEMQEQDLNTIYTSGQHLLMLINDVLDQAKIAAGKMDLKFGLLRGEAGHRRREIHRCGTRQG
jgi:signal transduction histidine kinase